MRRAAALALTLLGSIPARANLPPVATATASTGETLVFTPVDFDGSRSYDPDGGPSPLAFSWDFDDGSPPDTTPRPRHAFTAARVHNVTLTVSDGADSAVALVRVYVLAPTTPAPPVKSGPLALDGARGELWAVNEDAGTVAIVDTTWLSVEAESPAGRRPHAVAFDPGRGRAVVSDRAGGLLHPFDAATRTPLGAVAACRGAAGGGVERQAHVSALASPGPLRGRLHRLCLLPSGRRACGRPDRGFHRRRRGPAQHRRSVRPGRDRPRPRPLERELRRDPGLRE